MKGNNIILFPVDRTTGPRRRWPSLDAENIRVVTTAALVTILVVVSLLNNSLFSNRVETSSVHQGRAIASVGGESLLARQKFEKELVERLGNLEKGNVVVTAVSPSKVDHLRYEALEGKYILKFENGKLSSAALRGDESAIEPTLVSDDFAFIKQYENVWPVSPDAIQKISETRTGDFKVIAYETRSQNSRALVELKKDKDDRLLQINVKPAIQ